MSKLLGGFLVLAVCAAGANADYVGRVVGLTEGSGTAGEINVAAGSSFTGAVMLDSSSGSRNDSAIFRLVFSVSNLEYNAGWFDWSAPYTTGGIDDFSNPGADEAGAITPSTYLDLFDPDAVDVYFENVSDSFGQFFTTGILLTFTLTVPEELANVGSFTVGFVPDTFTDGASIVQATPGDSLLVNVIPSPAVFSTLALFGISGARRLR